MPQTYTLLLLGVSFFFLPAYGTITIQNSDFEFDDFNLNVTDPITVSSFLKEPDGFTTNNGELLRKYSFDNSTGFDVLWVGHTATFANFTITDIVTDVRGNVTNTELGSVELDQVSVSWTFTTLNIVSIDTAQQVEYFFPAVIPTPTLNAIVITLNSAANSTLGGVFSVICPTNSTLTGLYGNGTFICTDMSAFFP